MEIRGVDRWGKGHFGASRDGGDRTHNGVDIVARVGYPVYSPVDGVVTRIGTAYKSKPEYKYVEVTNDEYRYRLFYVNSIVKVGDEVVQGATIGVNQDLGKTYSGITPHVHFEIKTLTGGYIDPTPVIIALKSANISIV